MVDLPQHPVNLLPDAASGACITPSTYSRTSCWLQISISSALGALAVGYLKYILEALHSRELFGWLQLTPVRWWHVLHYRDSYNWGGVEACVSADMWEAGGGAADGDVMETVDPTEIGTPGGPKLT